VAKPIRFNAFDMNCVVHQSPGLWRHPRDRSRDYRRLDLWTDLAKTLERGLFDGVFLADVLGVYDVFGGGPAAALRQAAQVPVNDPLLLVPAMAAVTENLGFGVTVNLSYEPPYSLARRFSTLDHLTDGRIGWNVVTGYLDSAARAMGRARQTGHDDRYEVAEDFMAVVYKRWEASRASMRAPTGCARCGTKARSTASTRSICRNPHRNERRCCIRPAPRPPGAASPGATPNACSCRARRSPCSRPAWPHCGTPPSRPGAAGTTCASTR
jgi:alkanesulfonate monooxygenase SsuD/methylene tetrahydromethanopterin reductase-like flavin-dependent oxidoreductase (luciferase family)